MLKKFLKPVQNIAQLYTDETEKFPYQLWVTRTG